MSKAQKGKKMPASFGPKMSAKFKGRKMSDEFKEKIKASWIIRRKKNKEVRENCFG